MAHWSQSQFFLQLLHVICELIQTLTVLFSFVQVQVTYRTLSEAQPQPYRTPGVGRASEGRDFVPLMDSVVFVANQSEANITLRVLDDEDPERDESVFVTLVGVELVEGEQARPSKTPTRHYGLETLPHLADEATLIHFLSVSSSPSLGSGMDTVAQVIVEASDDAFGVLQLSTPAVSVAEDYVGPIINVTRVGGIFADVSVKFRAVPVTARVSKCCLSP